ARLPAATERGADAFSRAEVVQAQAALAVVLLRRDRARRADAAGRFAPLRDAQPAARVAEAPGAALLMALAQRVTGAAGAVVGGGARLWPAAHALRLSLRAVAAGIAEGAARMVQAASAHAALAVTAASARAVAASRAAHRLQRAARGRDAGEAVRLVRDADQGKRRRLRAVGV